MKKIKIFFWVALFGVMALFVYQNKAFFMTPQSFSLDLYLMGPYETPMLPNVLSFLVFFFLGLLIAYFYSLFGSYRQSKTIRHLNATVAAQSDEIASLRSQLAAPRPPEAPEGQTGSESTPHSSPAPAEA